MQYLEALCKDLGKPHEEYTKKLDKLRRTSGNTQQTQQPRQSQPAPQQAPPQTQRTARPARVEEEMNQGSPARAPMAAPRAGGGSNAGRPPPQRPQRPVEDEDDFGDTDVNMMLG